MLSINFSKVLNLSSFFHCCDVPLVYWKRSVYYLLLFFCCYHVCVIANFQLIYNLAISLSIFQNTSFYFLFLLFQISKWSFFFLLICLFSLSIFPVLYFFFHWLVLSSFSPLCTSFFVWKCYFSIYFFG